MTEITQEQISNILSQYIDPYLKKDLVSAKAIKQITIENTTITIDIVLGFPALGYHENLVREIKKLLQEKLNNTQINININYDIVSHAVQIGVKPLPGIKNIIAIASGKGGVGKSTTAVNLALALSAEGARVGILDADIYGPSQPMMLGANIQPEANENKKFNPVISHGIQSMSIGYLIDNNTAMIWRGPMVSSALQQLINDTQWDNLDYLIVDLPPGTGDIQLTLSQKIPVSGAVIVTTPQDIALLDARKAIAMFQKVNVAVLGVVENMSTHICSHCGHQEAIFGEGGAAKLAQQYQVDLLGSLPLDIKIREQADGGNPTVIAEPQSANALAYREIARRVSAKLSLQTKNYAAKFPTIVIEKN
jgi:ATP-binding protein involved in chromosome partitioning